MNSRPQLAQRDESKRQKKQILQDSEGFPSVVRKNSRPGGKLRREIANSGSKANAGPGFNNQPYFLNAYFPAFGSMKIPDFEYILDGFGKFKENLPTLLKDIKTCLRSYSFATGKKIEVSDLPKEPSEAIPQILDRFSKVLPPKFDYNIEMIRRRRNKRSKPRFELVLWKYASFDENTAYIMGCDFLPHLENTDPILAELIIDMLCFARYNFRLPAWSDESTWNFYLHYLADQYDEEINGGIDPEDIDHDFWDKFMIWAKGAAVDYQVQICAEPKTESELRTRVVRYTPKDQWQIRMKQCMLDCLDLSKAGRTIRDYSYDPMPSYEQMPMEYHFGILWSTTDDVFERLFQIFNDEAGNSGVCIPTYAYQITHEKKDISFEPDGWIERFRNWADFYATLYHEFMNNLPDVSAGGTAILEKINEKEK